MEYSVNSDSIIVEAPKAIYHKPCGILLFMYFGTVEDAKSIARIDKLMSVDGGKVDNREWCACKHCHKTLNTKEIDVVELENPVVEGLEQLQNNNKYVYDLNTMYELYRKYETSARVSEQIRKQQEMYQCMYKMHTIHFSDSIK